MKNTILCTTFLALFGASTTGFAHHSSAPHFDESTEIVLEATVTKWSFVNPHSYIYFDVTGENGEVENWRCEMHARTPMQRNGFTEETFFAGQKLTIIGAPARREEHVCGLTSYIYPDGTEIARNGALPEKYRIGTILDQDTLAVDTERPEYLENGQPNISGFWVRATRGGGPTTVNRGGAAAGGERGAGGGAAGGERGAAGGERGAGGGRAAGGAGGERGAAGGGRGRGTQYALTEAALAKQATYEQIYDNPSIHCDITNILFGWTHDANVNQVTQEDDKITLLYGYMDFVRTIHHPWSCRHSSPSRRPHRRTP